MMKARILLIDDKEEDLVLLRKNLEAKRYRVLTAPSAEMGLRLMTPRPDLIILDVVLPGMSGLDLLRKLRDDKETKDIPVIMLTGEKTQEGDQLQGLLGGADQYLSKPVNLEILHAHLRRKLEHLKPYSSLDDARRLTLYAVHGHSVHAHAAGKKFTADEYADDALKINASVMGAFGRWVDNATWRTLARDKGHELYDELIGKNDKIAGLYGKLRDELLHVRTSSLKDYLEVPFEHLCDAAAGEPGDYFVLRHAFARTPVGVLAPRTPVDRAFLNELYDDSEPLRVLLIASNTPPNIPGADKEVAALEKAIPQLFAEKGIEAEVTVVPTEAATHRNVKDVLRNSRHHIIHYAGHGQYNSGRPEESSLYFWEEEMKGGDVKPMRATELQFALKDSSARLLYLSCCDGGAAAGIASAMENDFLGIADAAVDSGVPAVLSYRWPVSDSAAKTLAHTFYKELAEDGRIDVALMRARQEIAGEDRKNPAWLSPVLFMRD